MHRPSAIQSTRRSFLRASLSAAAGASLLNLVSHAASPGRPPNIVFIFADDLGYGDLACYGNRKIRTPHLDRMAAEGLKFTSFYACAAVCTPSRAGLLTGRYQVRCGLVNVLFPKDKIGMPDSEITIAQALKQRGYATACIGKWHLGHLPPFLPTRHGFDLFYGIPYSNDMNPHPILRNEEVVEEKPSMDSLTARYTAEAIQFIETHKDKPFFLYMPHSMPHVPLGASANFKDKSAAGLYGDVIEELDASVGQVLATLRRLGLDDNTLVVFTSDNGPWLEKKAHGGSAGTLRAGKGTTFEGGVREPCIVRWPGHIAAGRVEPRPAIMLDWFPTFVKLAGGTLPTDRILDGCDISPLLFNTGKRAHEDFFFYIGTTLQAHRSGPWKLKLAQPAPRPSTQPAATAAARPKGQPLMLFNLDQDPNETTNLASQHPEVVQRLQSQIVAFQQTAKRPR